MVAQGHLQKGQHRERVPSHRGCAEELQLHQRLRDVVTGPLFVAGVGGEGRPRRQTDAHGLRVAQGVRPFECVLGQQAGICQVTAPESHQEAMKVEDGQLVLLASIHRLSPHRHHRVVPTRKLARPRQQERIVDGCPQRQRNVGRTVLKRECVGHRLVVETTPGGEVLHRPQGQGSTQEVGSVQFGGERDGLVDAAGRLVELGRIELRVRQQDEGVRASAGVVSGVGQRAHENRHHLGEVLFGGADLSEQGQCFRARPTRWQRVDDLVQPRRCFVEVRGVQVMSGCPDMTLGSVATEADGQIEQLCGGARRASVGRRQRRGVQGVQRLFVCDGSRQGEVSGPQLWLGDDPGERGVHPSAPGRRRVGVDTGGQQGMRKTHPLSLVMDELMVFRLVEHLRHVRVRDVHRPRDEVDGRRSRTGSGEQRFLRLRPHFADPGPNQIGKCCLHGYFTIDGRICQLQGVERVAAGDVVNAYHRRSRQR